MSAIDGRRVKFRGKDDWTGIVQGDSYTPGTVRVAWSEPVARTGVHRVVDLETLDEPPTQEDLSEMFYGVTGASPKHDQMHMRP